MPIEGWLAAKSRSLVSLLRARAWCRSCKRELTREEENENRLL